MFTTKTCPDMDVIGVLGDILYPPMPDIKQSSREHWRHIAKSDSNVIWLGGANVFLEMLPTVAIKQHEAHTNVESVLERKTKKAKQKH